VKPTAGFTTINRDDPRRQKVDRGSDSPVREDEGRCSGVGAERGCELLRGEVLGLHNFARADAGNADSCGVIQSQYREAATVR